MPNVNWYNFFTATDHNRGVATEVCVCVGGGCGPHRAALAMGGIRAKNCKKICTIISVPASYE